MNNRNVKRYYIIGCSVIALILAGVYVAAFAKVDPTTWSPNLPWLLPAFIAIIALFIAPVVTFTLNNWDIHLYLDTNADKIRFTVTNAGTTPFSFSRVQFASRKTWGCLGKREYYPTQGIYGRNVEYHGAGSLSQELHEHIGCTVKKGMPKTVTLRGEEIAEYLCHFGKGKKICLSLYWSETDDRVHSDYVSPATIRRLAGEA